MHDEAAVTTPMKTIELANHELSVADYSNFELNLLLRDGRITATVKPCGTNGSTRLRLIKPVILFDETRASEARIDSLLKARGFQRKAPSSCNGA
jgi:hypothetical protein